MQISKKICDQLSDQQIVDKALVNIDYFSCLYERYETKLLRYIKRIAALSNEEAEDVLQDAFIKTWRNLNNFDPSMKLSSWIYRIVHNETISYWRKSTSNGKKTSANLDQYLFQLTTTDTDVDIEAKEETTRQLLNLLPIKYKTVLVLKFIENLSYEDISDVLKIPEGTVGTRINRAKKAFAKIAKEKNISFDENF